jgi:proton-dependent oligopeptide transporter, POT family
LNTTAVADTPQRGFFGHPRGLSTLFFTEMWERFSYYGMRAILAMYMYHAVTEGGLGLPESTAKSVVSVYGASVYMTGIAGGWLADRLIGAQRAVLYGGVLIMFGHIAMAVPGGAPTLAIGLILIIIGTGLLKPNVSSLVGTLYSDDDARRDAGFSLYYMGINLGGFLAPLVVGWLQVNIGWHVGFGAAAVGMALGLIQYTMGRKNLGASSDVPVNPLPAERRRGVLTRVSAVVVAAVLVIAVPLAIGAIGMDTVVNVLSLLPAALSVVYFAVMFRSKDITAVERSRLRAYIPLFLSTALFFMLFEQQATTLTSVADKQTDLEVLGFSIPAAWFQSVNPVAILVLAPLFALLWLKLGDRQPSTPAKFVGGLAFVGVAYLWVVLSVQFANAQGLINPIMLALVFVLMTIGELMLSPVGLSATTKLAPKSFVNQTMGLYWLGVAAGQGMGALVVGLQTDENLSAYFGINGLVAIACAVLLGIGVRSIKAHMHGVR